MIYLKKYWKLGLVLIIACFLLFSGSKGYKMYKSLLRQNQSTQDSLIELSQKKQDSLLIIIDDGLLLSQTLTIKIDELNKSNRYLYRKLKLNEKALLTSDTSFINNAKRISKRGNRHRKENDTTQ